MTRSLLIILTLPQLGTQKPTAKPSLNRRHYLMLRVCSENGHHQASPSLSLKATQRQSATNLHEENKPLLT
jgi:hypothetical protein